MAGKKGVMPPQFAKNAARIKNTAAEAKKSGATGQQIAKHAAAAAKHLGHIARLSGGK